MKSIRIKRFKGFIDSGWIDLKPITLLFGYNSAGKSSIINALLMLKQSLENPSLEVPFVFTDKKGVDLGTFEDIAHKHIINQKEPIEIGLKLDISKEEFSSSKIVEANINREIEINIHIIYKDEKNMISFFDIKDIDGKLIFEMKLNRLNNWNYESDIYKKIDKKAIEVVWHNFLPIIQFKDSPNHELRYLTTRIKNNLKKYFEKLSNIGPVRAIPERTQQFIGENPLTVGVSGEEAFKLLYLSKHRKNNNGISLEEQVNKWLEQYNYRFNWKTLKGNFGQFVLIDTRNKDDIEVSIKDVGFGISQVLPIVIQVFDASNENTVIIEQPEIHLHSKAQAELGDLFIKAIKVKEEENSKKNLIIETHSENLLLRLRRRIAETFLGDVENSISISKND